MKCKNVLGVKVCKLSSSEVVRLPDRVNQKVSVNIYTSKDCRLCKPLVSKQLKSLLPIRNLVSTKIVDVSNSNSIHPDVLSLPNMQIGNKILGARPTDKDIVKTLRNHFPMENVN